MTVKIRQGIASSKIVYQPRRGMHTLIRQLKESLGSSRVRHHVSRYRDAGIGIVNDAELPQFVG